MSFAHREILKIFVYLIGNSIENSNWENMQQTNLQNAFVYTHMCECVCVWENYVNETHAQNKANLVTAYNAKA